MESDSCLPLIIVIVILVIISAFFSASETAFSSLNLIKLKTWADSGSKKAIRTAKLAEKYDELLSAILIGNNVVNIVAASLSTILFINLLGSGKGPTVSTIILTVVILIFGEITPKAMAKERPEKFAMLITPVLNGYRTILFPLTWIFSCWKKLLKKIFRFEDEDQISEDEVITMVNEAEDDGTFNKDESELIRSAINFDDLEVGSVLVHRVDVSAIEDEASMQELFELFQETGFSRIPVYHDSLDNIIGVVLQKDFYPAYINGETDIDKCVTDVSYTTEKTKVSHLLSQLQIEQNHMAVVIDEYGGTQGIVTMEDILEELVGEIWDESDDVEDMCRRQTDGSWIVKGHMPMDDFAEIFGISQEERGDNVTVAGWVLEQTGEIPKEGQSFSYKNINVTVARVKRRCIDILRVKNCETEK